MRVYSAAVAAIVVIAFGASAPAQPAAERHVPAVAAIEQALEAAIVRAGPSVVAISRTSPKQPPANNVFDDLRKPVGDAATSNVVASGVIIDQTGLVLTEYLAVRDGDDHKISTIEGESFPAKIRAADPRSGLAVLEITPKADLQTKNSPQDNEPRSFPAIKLNDTSTLHKGQFVVAIGNPFAIESDGQPTASFGIITNLARKAPPGTNFNNAPGTYKDFRTTIHHLGTLVQTDAKLGWNAGGGALVNLNGELIGLTTTASVIAGHEQPAGYAIPMTPSIRRVVDQLKEGREVEYGMLGVGFGAPGILANPNDPAPLRVTQVYPNGPAARAGLQAGDILTNVNGNRVGDVDDVQLAISALAPKSTTTVAYERAGKPETANVTLAKLAVAGKSLATKRAPAWRGMRVDFATTLEAPALADAINSRAFDEQGCVLVSEVEPDSVAWRAGVRPGMFVSHVGGKRVTTPDEFQAAAADVGEDFDVTFTKPLSPKAPAAQVTP